MLYRIFLPIIIVFSLCAASIFRNNLWNDPVALWNDTISKSPKKIRPYINLSAAYIGKKDLDSAEKVLFKTTDVFRDVILSGNIYYLGASIEIFLNFASIYGLKGDLDRVAEFLNKAYETYPDSVKVNYALGFFYMQLGNIDKAEDYFKKAISISPEPLVYARYAEIMEVKGRYDDAIKYMAMSVELDPRNAYIRNRLGILLKMSNKAEEAEMQWREAISIDKKFLPAYTNLGSVMYEKGRLKEAYKFYMKAIEIDDSYYEAYVGAGNVLDDMGQDMLAIEMYKSAIAIDPQRIEGFMNLGITLEKIGKKEEALKAYEDALKIEQNNKEILQRIRRLKG